MEDTNSQSFEHQAANAYGHNHVTTPKLYSDTAILGFSLFFSTFFASFLLIENLKQVDARKGIIPVILFSISFMVVEYYLINLLPAKANSLSLPFNLLGGAVLNFYFWRKYIPHLHYEKKKIWKPLIIGLVLVAVMFGLMLGKLQTGK